MILMPVETKIKLSWWPISFGFLYRLSRRIRKELYRQVSSRLVNPDSTLASTVIRLAFLSIVFSSHYRILNGYDSANERRRIAGILR